MTTSTDNARNQAEAQLEYIRELMEWLEHANECGDRDDCTWFNGATNDLAADTLEAHDPIRAEQAIHENASSIEIRTPWITPGTSFDETGPGEFRILLRTDRPAVRIMGTLDEHGQPDSATIEYQDWSTPWIALHDIHAADPIILGYAQQFYFGG